MKKLLPLLITFISLTSQSATAQYTEVVYDSFEYANGPIGGLDGGKGWSDTWWSGATGDGGVVETPGMDGLGGMLTSNIEHEGSYRLIDTAPLAPILDGGTLGKDGTTLWISFTLQRAVGGDDFYGGISLNWQWNTEQLFIGSPWGSDELGIEKPWVTGSTTIFGTSVDVENTMVTRIDFLPGDDRVQVWANPGVDYPTTVADIDQLMPDIHFNEIKFASGTGLITGFHFDDFSISTPEFGPTYSVANLVGGSSATLTVSNAAPGATVAMAYSLAGAGPTNTPYGPVDMSAPIRRLPPVVADGAGVASVTANVPAGAVGANVWTQAVELTGSGGLLTNSLALTVQ
jgi:hypothetical protein